MSAYKIHKDKPDGTAQLDQLYDMLRELFDANFYGSLEVKFEAGKVTIVRKIQSMKL